MRKNITILWNNAVSLNDDRKSNFVQIIMERVKMFFINRLKHWYIWRKDPSGTLYYRQKGAHIGKNCTFIGDNIGLSSEPYLIKIKDNVRVSFDVNFITHDGGTYVLRQQEPNICIYGPIIVNENTFIGAQSIILPNIVIGKNVIVGAGSIVTKSIPDNEVWAGVPARRICTIDEYKGKNAEKFSYILHDDYETKKRKLLEIFNDLLKD